jgi:aconitate hydratase
VIPGRDSLKTKKTLKVGGKAYSIYSLKAAEAHLGDLSRLPY